MTSKRLMEIDDLFRMRIVDDPCVDPSGRLVAFTVTRLDRDGNTYRSQIWQLDLQSGDLVALTAGEHRDGNPRWSPDGRWLAFTSNRRENDERKANRIWIMPAGGGEPRPLTPADSAVEGFDWSPDSRQVAYVAPVHDPEAAAEAEGTDVMVIRTPRFRFDGMGFLRDRYRQIFVIDIDGREPHQVTSGRFDHTQIAWSPNGFEIAFASNREVDWELSNVRDIYVVRLPGGQIRRVTDGQGSWGRPAWSPSGDHLACFGTRRIDISGARTEIFVCDSTGDGLRSITADIDCDFHDAAIADWAGYQSRPPIWLGEKSIAAVISERGAVRLARVGVESGELEVLTPERGRVGAPAALPDGGFVLARNDFVDPGELYHLSPGGELKAVTTFNEGWHAEVELSQPEPLSATSPDGEEIHGWFLPPTGPVGDGGAPLLLEIHGGPFGMYAETMMHEFHLLSAQGYAVAFCNPRGSAGYGDRFAQILAPEMGENDFPDFMAFVDAALDRDGLDASRLGVLGGSYGGFMTNWIIGHTDRFKAAVTMRCISDWFSTWGTDDIFFADCNVTLGATPWENPEIYLRLSPITYVEQMTTPLLIVHSEEDYRCPIGQAEQLFTSLKALGRTTELVRFPDESHGLSRTGQPKHRVERLEHILRWFETHL